jgi:hypothetical protein
MLSWNFWLITFYLKLVVRNKFCQCVLYRLKIEIFSLSLCAVWGMFTIVWLTCGTVSHLSPLSELQYTRVCMSPNSWHYTLHFLVSNYTTKWAIYPNIYIYMYMCVCVYIHIYIHTHTYKEAKGENNINNAGIL